MCLSTLIVLALALPALSQDRDEGWRSDIDFFVNEAQRVHAEPTRPAYSEAFLDAAEQLRGAVSDLDDEEVLLGLMQLAAILDDGHTAIYGPGAGTPLEVDGRVLPLKFYLFPDGLYVLDAAEGWEELVGARITRFGEVDAQVALGRMSTYRGGDNAMTWTWMGPQFYVGRLMLLRAVGVEDVEGTVTLGVVDLDGEERSVEVPTGSHSFPRKLRPFPLGIGEAPRYLRNVDANFWMEPLEEHDALYFQFNQVRDAGAETISAFSQRLDAALKESGARTLIVDVRHNNGGNNTLVRPLVRTLVGFEMASPDHRIFVLMGRNTFSAAQNFLNRVERWTDAVFVGEPSSSSPNFTGEENEIELPWSRARGSLSNLYWQDSDPWDERPWIEPDIPVELEAQHWVLGADPALERVLLELD